MSRVLAVWALVALGAAPATAQVASAGAVWQRYTTTAPADVGLHTVELMTAPFAATAPLTDDVMVRVAGAYARGSLRLDNGSEESTSGWTDTHMALEIGGERLGFTARVMIPTGEVVQDVGDAALVGLLASDLLPFDMAQWSTGGGVSGEVTYGVFGPRAALRAAAGGAHFGASEPLGGTLAYRPGWQLLGRAVLDVAIGPAGVLSAVVGYQHFGIDSYGGRNLFQAGPRLEGTLTYTFPLNPRAAVNVYGGARHVRAGFSRFDPRLLSEVGSALAAVSSPSSRTLFHGGGELRVAYGRTALRPHVEARVLRRADGTGQGWSTSLGARAGVPVLEGRRGPAMVVQPRLALRLGQWIAADDITSRVLGWEAGLTVRWTVGS